MVGDLDHDSGGKGTRRSIVLKLRWYTAVKRSSSL